MTSSIKRRSGNAVVQFCGELGWRPTFIFQVGVGVECEEVVVFKETWPDVPLYGCEPNGDTVRSMAPKYPGELFECAVTDHRGTATLHTKSKHKNGSSLCPFFNHNKRNRYDQMTVAAETLDSMIPSKVSVFAGGLLWLDCEGSEVTALRGGLTFLEYVDVINIEMSCRPLGENWADPKEAHAILCEAGFVQSWCHTNRIHARQFDAIYVRRRIMREDLCMCLSEVSCQMGPFLHNWKEGGDD